MEVVPDAADVEVEQIPADRRARIGGDDRRVADERAAVQAEGQLAADLGVSRGSVREAIKALESLGIVEVRHGDGVRVRAFNFDSTFDLLSYGLVFDPARIKERHPSCGPQGSVVRTDEILVVT